MTSQIIPRTDYDVATQAAGRTVALSSQRIYQHTYNQWRAYCADIGLDPLADLQFMTASDFLAGMDGSKASKVRSLAALRKLAEILSAVDLDNTAHWQAILNGLKLIKPKHLAGHEQRRTARRALTPQQVHRIFDVWSGDEPQAVRNTALFATLAYTGMRRAELCALHWADFDLEKRTVDIIGGKGDKDRTAAVFGADTVDHLRRWQAVQGDNLMAFTSLDRRPDYHGTALTTDAILKLCRLTSARIADRYGEALDFKPHDLRRTFITDALNHGAPLHEVQAQVGHASGETTLIYAQASDAIARHGVIKLGY